MRVREIMSTHVQQIRSDASVSEAADTMRNFDVGILPVLEGNKVVGILTDRDIVIRAVAAGLDPEETTVRDVMTSDVLGCSFDDDVETVAQIMEDNQVRRLVVLNDQQLVVGIVSLGDLAVKSRDERLSYEVLEKVCEPSHVSW
ncbi:MAG: CBS domain-containing protein [Planctomycetaceae bacterium]|nr:CBS domain-containing protein [Planctomycetaceae bacterium]